MHNSTCVGGVDVRGDIPQHLLYFYHAGRRVLRTIELLHRTVHRRNLPHSVTVAYLPHLALRTNSNLLASFQRPPFPQWRRNTYCTSPAQANLIFTSANASTCRSRTFGVERTRDFPGTLFDSHYQRMHTPRPPSHGSILVFRIVAEDKERALAEAPKNMRR